MENRQNQTNINWYPGHMAKTKRLIKENYNLIDVVYELVDARIPYSSKIKDIDEIIKNKKTIIIMTKYDLCDKEETEKWKKYYESLGKIVLCVDLNKKEDIKKILDTTNLLTKDIQNNRIKKGLKTKEIRVLVIGVPNVGKSTLINSIVSKKAVAIGNKPGITKSLSWIKTANNILLLDTPGILWPKLENDEVSLNLASMTAIKNEIIPIDKVAIHILNKLDKYYNEILQKRYDIGTMDMDIVEVYDKIGRKIGAIVKGGQIDYDRVSNAIINDIKNEYVKGVTFDRRELWN